MTKVKEFNNLIGQRIKELIPLQTVWVTVESVDWEAKTMTAKSLSEEPPYYNVLLGLFSEYKKPAIGSRCLISQIENKSAAYFLVYANELEEYLITDKTGFKLHLKEGVLQLNGDSFSGIVKAQELKQQLDKNTALLQKIQQVFMNWVAVPQDGGNALKALSAQFINMQTADLSNIENEKIKHG